MKLPDEYKNSVIEIQIQINEKYNFNIVDEYIKFITTKVRFPSKDTNDEMERTIAIKYEREFKDLPFEDISKVDEAINKIGRDVLYENSYKTSGRK